jgi:hypothetical protein
MAQFSENIDLVVESLHAFQGEVTAVTKDGDNPFFSSRYATLNAVIDTVRPLLNKNNLVVTQFPDDEGLTTILAHTSGQHITAYAKLANISDPQKQGSSITYMRRYALSSILGLTTEDDDDAQAATEEVKKTTRKNSPLARSLTGNKPKWKS